MGLATSIVQFIESAPDTPKADATPSGKQAKPSTTLKAATAATAAIAAPHAAKKRSSKSKDVSQDEAGAYAVQVGIFAHPAKVREALKKADYTIKDSAITLRSEEHTSELQ